MVACRPLGKIFLPLQLLGLLLCWLLSTLSVLPQVVVRVGSMLLLLRRWLLILLIVLLLSLLIPTLIGLSTVVLPLIFREWLPVILLPLVVLPLISTSAVIVSPTVMLMLILIVSLIAVARPVMTGGLILIFSSAAVVVSVLAFASVGPLLTGRPLVLL